MAGRLYGLDAADPAVTPRKGGERGIELGSAELGPQAIGEVQLRIGHLPEQEVADAHLAAGADEKVRVRRMRQRHELAQPCFVELLGRKPGLDRAAAGL